MTPFDIFKLFLCVPTESNIKLITSIKEKFQVMVTNFTNINKIARLKQLNAKTTVPLALVIKVLT